MTSAFYNLNYQQIILAGKHIFSQILSNLGKLQILTCLRRLPNYFVIDKSALTMNLHCIAKLILLQEPFPCIGFYDHFTSLISKRKGAHKCLSLNCPKVFIFVTFYMPWEFSRFLFVCVGNSTSYCANPIVRVALYCKLITCFDGRTFLVLFFCFLLHQKIPLTYYFGALLWNHEQNGTLLLHGHGMLRMKLVGYVGWLLMVAVLIVNSLGMIAR